MRTRRILQTSDERLPWEQSTNQQGLDEDLGVEGEGRPRGGVPVSNAQYIIMRHRYSRVEGSSRDCHIDDIGSGNRMRRQEGDDFICIESSIREPLQDGRDGVGRLRNCEVGSRCLGGRAPEEEFELWSTRAVRSTDSGSKVDEVTSRQVRGLENGELTRYNVVDTTVGV